MHNPGFLLRWTVCLVEAAVRHGFEDGARAREAPGAHAKLVVVAVGPDSEYKIAVAVDVGYLRGSHILDVSWGAVGAPLASPVDVAASSGRIEIDEPG